ncbi:leucine-rich repeat domain-containing protein, partial [Candidatus Poribacteria bacterium]|nr:leucine-rich repeat domain-containing protein [Candidatus Poribacteria bacterium]
QRLSCILTCIGCLLILLISACVDAPNRDIDDNTDNDDYNYDDGGHAGPPTGNIIFERTLAKAVGKVPGEEITPAELATLTHLTFPPPHHSWVPGAEWTEIALLAYCINLKELDLYGHQIRDLRPLAGLTHLTKLNLSSTGVSDLEPLAGLINLQTLDLSARPPFVERKIRDITPLAGLIKLKELHLENNQIRDITPLTNLIQINKLYLQQNMIVDLKPLVDNPGLVNKNPVHLEGGFDWHADAVGLHGNPLSDVSRNVYIPALEARGVIVRR